MKAIRFTEADKNLKTVLDTVNDSDNIITITRCDVDDSVIMSLKNYNSLMETLYLLKSPANNAHLAESIGQCRDGKTTAHSLADEISY
jgi:antitoxin YefM